MGGQGSGRHGRRPVADRSRPLHIRQWYDLIRIVAHDGRGSERDVARMRCLSDSAEEVMFRCVLASSRDGALSLRLFLEERLVYTFDLTSTAQQLGGVRWWWVCPDCGRRAAILYAPRGLYWCCRRCANRITYQSSNASDKRLAAERLAETLTQCRQAVVPAGAFQAMSTRQMVRYLHAADRRMVLLFKALDRLRVRDER